MFGPFEYQTCSQTATINILSHVVFTLAPTLPNSEPNLPLLMMRTFLNVGGDDGDGVSVSSPSAFSHFRSVTLFHRKWQLSWCGGACSPSSQRIGWQSTERKEKNLNAFLLGSRSQPKWTFESQVFEWSGLSFGYSYGPNHLKTRSFKIVTFLSRFQIVFEKMASFCPDFKWLASRFQIPFKIRTICNPTSF